MVYFHTKNPSMDTFWRDLEWKLNILLPFGKMYIRWVVFGHFGTFFPRSGMLRPGKIWQPCTGVKEKTDRTNERQRAQKSAEFSSPSQMSQKTLKKMLPLLHPLSD
jgi:hypothetical protein